MFAKMMKKPVIALALAFALGMVGRDLSSQRAHAQIFGQGNQGPIQVPTGPVRPPVIIIAQPHPVGGVRTPGAGSRGTPPVATTRARPGGNDHIEGYIRANELPNLVRERNRIPEYLQHVRTLDGWLAAYPTHPHRVHWLNDRARLINWVNTVSQAYGRATRVRIYFNAPGLPVAPHGTRDAVLNYLRQGNNWMNLGKAYDFRAR